MGLRRIAGDVDNDARAPFLHQRIIGPTHIDITEHLQIPGLAPGLLVDIEQLAAGNGAGIIHQNVNHRKISRQTLDRAAVR